MSSEMSNDVPDNDAPSNDVSSAAAEPAREDVPAAQPWRWWGWATLRWIIDKRAVSPWYLIRYARFLRVVVFTRGVTFTGPIFLGRGARFEVRHRVGRVIVGRWVHLGSGTVVRCHEGTLRIGDKCVFGQNNTINCHLDVEIGDECIVADSVYVGDFDHRMDVTDVPVRSQGLVKSPVIIGPDVWLGVKSTILRGSVVGRGCVVGAHALVRGDVPEFSIVGGVPARVIADRRVREAQSEQVRRDVADMARKAREATRERIHLRDANPV